MAGLIILILIGLAVALWVREGRKGPIASYTGSGCGCFLAVGLLLLAVLVYFGGQAESRFYGE
ncbi:hypothetical protein SLUN_19275 [Streptomyces lunaelactis]|uniref:Uncharacterized protein n=1 Tax=Streptomyces lunaelactis TaxID=1535768 RepID=A0A2R4T4D9_9ACTN|nr:hypothetical protein SLUN_19275 [Streptomyces lunaelactis]